MKIHNEKSTLPIFRETTVAKISQGQTKAVFEKKQMVLKFSSLISILPTQDTKLRQPVCCMASGSSLPAYFTSSISNPKNYTFSIISTISVL